MKQEYSIWLDDERPMPSGYNKHFRTAEEVIAFIKENNKVYNIACSLDNDLGIGYTEGKKVAQFIEKAYMQDEIDFIDFYPHTGNPVAWDEIMACRRTVFKKFVNT
jgi:hypothetical protein